jgi:hypothetical protein
MAKKAAPEPAPRGTSWIVKSSLVLLAVAAFLGGLIALGRWGQEWLQGRERYDVPFADIDCNPPAGMERKEFLAEARSAAKFDEPVNLIDEDLPARLREGFAQHPWVEKVDDVTIEPPNRIRVKLTHRTPVLAVKTADKVHAVDGHGVLLPANAPTRELPSYDGPAKSPKGPPGTRWGDPNIEAAARKLRK